MKPLIHYRRIVFHTVKRVFGIANLTALQRRLQRKLERLIYRKKFTAKDLLEQMKRQGLKPGSTLIVHCAMNNFYNYRGTVNEIIDTILDYIGPEGTLCMPAFPYDKENPNRVFDVRSAKTAAGLLAETFRNYPNVQRSLNQLHSVCALGRNAEYICGDHQNSLVCFDEHSPFYKIGELGGLSFNLGLPKWFIGTGGHVCEALLFHKPGFTLFDKKFTDYTKFTYIDRDGHTVEHCMYTGLSQPYIRNRTTRVIDKYFDKTKYHRSRLSNIWINSFDMKYLIERLTELALQGITIYTTPRFSPDMHGALS